MARVRTGQQIIDDARELADKVNDPHVSDATALVWASQALAELWEMLISADPKRTLSDTVVTVTDSTVREYALPADFHSIVAVDFERNGKRYPVEPFDFHDRRFGDQSVATNIWGQPTARYRVMRQGIDGSDTVLYFDAEPGVGDYRVWYTITAPLAFTVATQFDGVAGWEDFITNEVAINMMGKERADMAWLLAKQARIVKRIEKMASRRDIGRPGQIQDTYSRQGGRGGRWMR